MPLHRTHTYFVSMFASDLTQSQKLRYICNINRCPNLTYYHMYQCLAARPLLYRWRTDIDRDSTRTAASLFCDLSYQRRGLRDMGQTFLFTCVITAVSGRDKWKISPVWGQALTIPYICYCIHLQRSPGERKSHILQ